MSPRSSRVSPPSLPVVVTLGVAIGAGGASAIITTLLITPSAANQLQAITAAFFEALAAFATVLALLVACYFALAAVEAYQRSRALDEQLESARKQSAHLDDQLAASKRALNAIHEVNLAIHRWAYYLAEPLVKELVRAERTSGGDPDALRAKLNRRLKHYYDEIELSRARVLIWDCGKGDARSCLHVLKRCGNQRDIELVGVLRQRFPEDREITYLCTRALKEISKRSGEVRTKVPYGSKSQPKPKS